VDATPEPAASGSPVGAPGKARTRRRLPRPLLFLGLLLALGAALLLVGICSGVIERSFIYFPDRQLIGDPADYGLPFDDVSFTADDGVQLHGWFVPGESDVTWLWFHGNAGNISHRLENLRLLHDELRVAVFLFDYRGYGRSAGTPSEEGTYRDGEAALDYLLSRPDVDPQRIVYFGRSLGAGIAVELATRRPPFALILESPVPSISDLAKHHYPFLPVRALLQTKYDSVAKIGNVRAPLLVLHGDRDEVVPFEGGRKLFEAAAEPKRFYTISGAGHNDTYVVGGREYFRVLREFVEAPPQ
jgi:fermentation-respiration switch protein FrsA (DUF1100 family)